MKRSQLLFLFMLLVMVFLALAPGDIAAFKTSGENRHALAFGVLPLVSAMAWPRVGLWVQFLLYSALGGAIEIAQYYRHQWHKAEYGDWLTDTAATAAAVLLVAALRWARQRNDAQGAG